MISYNDKLSLPPGIQICCLKALRLGVHILRTILNCPFLFIGIIVGISEETVKYVLGITAVLDIFQLFQKYKCNIINCNIFRFVPEIVRTCLANEII